MLYFIMVFGKSPPYYKVFRKNILANDFLIRSCSVISFQKTDGLLYNKWKNFHEDLNHKCT